MPTFSTPAPMAASMTCHDLAVAHGRRADEEQRLVLARLEDVAELVLGALAIGDVLLVDGQPVVGRVLGDDLAERSRPLGVRVGLERQVDVHALLASAAAPP